MISDPPVCHTTSIFRPFMVSPFSDQRLNSRDFYLLYIRTEFTICKMKVVLPSIPVCSRLKTVTRSGDVSRLGNTSVVSGIRTFVGWETTHLPRGEEGGTVDLVSFDTRTDPWWLRPRFRLVSLHVIQVSFLSIK